MKPVLLFGGTTEGRVLSAKLAAAGIPVTVSVATELGAEVLSGIADITVLVGRRSAEEMSVLAEDYSLCVDATHPYAVEASANIASACQSAGIPLYRLLRQESDFSSLRCFDSAENAAEFLAGTTGNILLTTGTKELGAFARLDPARLYARVLPTHAALDTCEGLGLPHGNILALQGPFSYEMNLAMLRQYHIRYLVSKDGGRAGGFGEKRDAARDAGAELLLLRRPREQGQDLDTIFQEVLTKWSR